jgi:hypothetical protein
MSYQDILIFLLIKLEVTTKFSLKTKLQAYSEFDPFKSKVIWLPHTAEIWARLQASRCGVLWCGTHFLATISVSPVIVIPRLVHMGSIFEKNGNGTGFSPSSSPVSIIPSVLYTHISCICQKHYTNLTIGCTVT